MVILVEVDARSWPGKVVTVLSDDDVEGADAETLLTTEDTMERSTMMCVSLGVYVPVGKAEHVALTFIVQSI